MKIKSLYCILFFAILFGTVSLKAQNSTTEEVKSLIKKKREFNKEKGYGFRIQIYYGSEVEARTQLKSFNLKFPNIKTYIDYSDPPYWKSLVGDYKTRLVADRILNDIKIQFPSAIIVPR